MTDQTRWRTQLGFSAVLLVMLIAMVRIVQYHWREGAAIIGAALLLAAGLRALLPAEQAGLLAIRRRGLDVLTYVAFGVLVLALALTITGGPLTDA
ncbi:MAG TPA: DUF3017 domain-containing protein [Pseudonocardiaceae bacterium]|jgi:hypothetical protein